MTVQQKMVLTALVAAIVGFGIGALWQYTSARGYAGRLDTSERELTFQRLEATLGAATIEAQRGSYEIARQLASDFFSGLQSTVEQADEQQQRAFSEMLQRRDAMITTLSRADPQSGSLLAQLFTQYRIAMGEPVGPTGNTVGSPPMPEPTDTGATTGGP